jgi:deazaflavin-dependent oxidoreductase (nitroreductase family)
MELSTLARLKEVAAKQTMTLTHYGRKTGKLHEVTIWFALDGDKLYISTANVNRQWVRNVQRTPQIRLSIGSEIFEGAARFLAYRADHERAMAAIRRKYWMVRPIIALGRVLTAIGVMRDNTGSFEVTLADGEHTS